MKSCKLGEFEIFWLNGGEFELDGGTMFGVVPKVLWAKKYPADHENPRAIKENYIKLLNYPLLVKTPNFLVLVETGLGNKLTEKQKQIYRVTREWDLPNELKKIGFTRQDIDYVILTHCDFDHAGGVVMHNENGKRELTFPNARHIIQELEWKDAIQPNIRSVNTYFEENFSGLKDTDNLQLVEGDYTVCPGVEVRLTGGHTRGHQIVRLQSGKEIAYHLADLLPTHVHFNPLWIMAYDNFPMDVIELKVKYEATGIREHAWFTFYHDPAIYACRFDKKGQVIEKIAREMPKKPAEKIEKMVIQNVNVGDDYKVIISCPSCLNVREVPAEKYLGSKHSLKVNCRCGTTFGVKLNFRKHYRKEVSIGGYYTFADRDVGGFDVSKGADIPFNCRIKNISLGGLGFIPLNTFRGQVGDRLRIKFTLDKNPPELIEKEGIVRSTKNNFIGCEFIEEAGFADRTLGFYLMK